MKEGIVSLYRYYLQMRHMQSRFMHELGGGNWHEHMTSNPKYMGFLVSVDPPAIYLAMWQATLYVLIEGWTTLGLKDDSIDRLIESPNVAALKEHRHGTFHYQFNLVPKKCRELLRSETVVEWTHALSDSYHRYFQSVTQSDDFREHVIKETTANKGLLRTGDPRTARQSADP